MLYVPTYTFYGRSVKWGNILACSSHGRFTLGSEEMNNIARVNIFIVWETSKNCDCRSKCVDCFVGITWKTYPFVLIELNQENASSLGRRDGVIWVITQAISSWWRWLWSLSLMSLNKCLRKSSRAYDSAASGLRIFVHYRFHHFACHSLQLTWLSGQLNCAFTICILNDVALMERKKWEWKNVPTNELLNGSVQYQFK